MSARWNYVVTTCVVCNREGKIRIDQFNRKNKTWECRSCAFKKRKLNIKTPSLKHDSQKSGAYKSYWRAKKRVKENHKNAYGHVLFCFNSFDEFWELLGERPEGMSLDRIDPHGNYEPGNVRWATTHDQVRNKRNNVLIEYKGNLMCLNDIAKITKLDPGCLRRRLKTGCPKEFLFKQGKWLIKQQKFIPKPNGDLNG
jgi:hypothetical protein